MPNETTFSGGYGSPIVMGRTPWTRTVVRPSGLGMAWPPLDDAERLDRYREFEALVENRHADVFARLNLKPEQKEKIAIAVALPELLCNVWADSVWSDPPSISFDVDGSAARWKKIDEANDWTEQAGWESVFAAAMRGTSIVRLFRSEELGEITGSPVQIEEVDAGIFFPKLRAGSSRLLDYVVLAWEENRPLDNGKDELWHVREVHSIDPAESGRYTIVTSERRAKTESFNEIKREVTTLDFLPFVDMHAGRWSGRYWGISELSRGVPLFDDIDNTLSNIAEILEYHGKPVLQVPASSLVDGTFQKGADRTLGIRNAADKDVARYVTYDGQLDSQMASIDKTLDLFFLTNEVPAAYFGRGVNGELASGTAMRLTLQNYLKKAARWQRRETLRAKKVVDFALRIDGVTDEKARIAKVEHGSPLPADDEQEARIETSLVTGGLSSKKTSLRKLRRFDSEEEIDDELAEIEDEKEASVSAAQNAFGGAFGAGADPNATPPGSGRQQPPPSRRGGSSAQRQA